MLFKNCIEKSVISFPGFCFLQFKFIEGDNQNKKQYY